MKRPSSSVNHRRTSADRCRRSRRVTSAPIIFIMAQITSSLLFTFVFVDFCQSIRILCLVLTVPSNLGTRALAVNATWGPRCDRLFFITELPFYQMTFVESAIAKQLPIAPIHQAILPGYHHLTQKVTLALQFAYEQYRDEFDWIVKADDDTYLLVDHLRDFLREKSASEPVTFGFNFKILIPQGYHSGGAGYVLSREALGRFALAHQSTIAPCSSDGGSEDVEIARCLRKQSIYPGNSRDELGHERFHPLPFSHHIRGMFPDWLHTLSENPLEKGFSCCAERSISFHYVPTEEQYLMDFLYLSTQDEEE